VIEAVIETIQPDWPAPANIQAFTTTRKGGVSQGPWQSLNLGGNCGDDPQHVRENRELLQQLLPENPHWLRQVHGTNVVTLDRGSELQQDADACVANTAEKVCAILTADCLPVLFCNEAGTKVAAAHAGWRGLAKGVLEATVAAMDCNPSDLIAWLGPAIGPNAFEVQQDVYDAFCTTNPGHAVAFRPHNDRWLADLYTLARLALAGLGVDQLSGGQHCTYSDREKFFSYRRDGETGRIATLIWITE
jgi:YfiH family protein